MNQAVAQGLVFGTDIIFTYGPYASVITGGYHPATDHAMIGGSLLFGTCYFLSFWLLGRGRSQVWLVFPGVVLAGLMYSKDAVLFSYPLLVALVTYRITLPDGDRLRLELSRLDRVTYLALFCVAGFLPLIKVTLLLVSASVAGCCFVLLWRSRQPRFMACSALLLPPAFGILMWVVAGQPLAGLPQYVLNSAPIISGYSEAMAVRGPSTEIWLYLGVCVAIILAVAVSGSADVFQRVVIALCYMLVLFVAFKNGFVRHDGHAFTAATALILTALTLPLVLKRNPLLIGAALTLSLFVSLSIDQDWTRLRPSDFVNNVVGTYGNAWTGVVLRSHGADRLRHDFDEANLDIAQRWPRPKIDGTADLYSNHQTILFAAGIKWSPRPVMQSYSAYTTSLAKLNELHLRSRNAPDNIILQVESIDFRYPSLDDGYSWPTIINNYTPFSQNGILVFLKKRASPHVPLPPITVLSREAALGDEVVVPDSKEPLFAEIGVLPTFAGRILSFLYKPPLLEISVHLADGGRRTFRLISGMASAGFFLTPLVETNSDFIWLGAASHTAGANKVVKSFTVSVAGGDSLCWKRSYSVRLTRPDLLRDTSVQ